MPNYRPSADEWKDICQQYRSRSCTQKEFCEKLGINSHSLSYHLAKHKKKPSFVPARIEPQAQSSKIELQLPHGITLLIRNGS